MPNQITGFLKKVFLRGSSSTGAHQREEQAPQVGRPTAAPSRLPREGVGITEVSEPREFPPVEDFGPPPAEGDWMPT